MASLVGKVLRAVVPPRWRWVARELLAARGATTMRRAWRVPLVFRGAAASGQPELPATVNAFLPTALCALMRREGSDKGMGWHSYTPFYHALFASRRHQVRRVFEMGLGTTDPSIPSNMGVTGVPGASLRAWRTWFPRARVFGADIVAATLFQEERITTYACDQTDPQALSRLWSEHAELAEPFDLIVDDGLHEPEANRCFFEHSCHKLAVGGFFMIEDVTTGALPEWAPDRMNALLRKFPGFRMALVRIPHRRNRLDNNLVICQRVR